MKLPHMHPTPLLGECRDRAKGCPIETTGVPIVQGAPRVLRPDQARRVCLRGP